MVQLPDIWGDGILFAFSGMDGETSWSHSLVAWTCTDPPGLFFPRYKVSLLFPAMRVGTVRVAANDLIDLDLIAPDGDVVRLQATYADRHNLVGMTTPPLSPVLDERAETMALCTCLQDGALRFSLAEYAAGRDAAQKLAESALGVDLDALWAQRRAFYERLSPCPSAGDPRLARLYSKACGVLKVNAMTPEGKIAHRWTTPDRWPHRHMWLWDSAFHAPAYAHLDPAWGEDALLAVLDMQRADGFIAHMMTPVQTSEITQPPILAWACWQVFEISQDRAFLRAAYPALCRYLEWDLRNRDWNRNGLLGWLIEGRPLCRSGESGMDNSSRFDGEGPWDSIDLNTYVANDMRHVVRIARELGRHAEAVQWEGRADALSARVNRLLWDEETGFYYDRSVRGELLRLKSNAGLLPLLAGIPTAGQAARLVEHLTDVREFWAPFPVPTIALDEPSHEPDMWRGPTWINVNAMIRLGLLRYGYADLAEEVRTRTLGEISRWYETLGCLYEYYDCQAQTPPPQLDRKGAPGSAGGTGFGVISDYNWTAAWTVLMLLDG